MEDEEFEGIEYVINIYYKQGDDLHSYLKSKKGDAKKALLAFADGIEANAESLEKLVKLFEGKELIVSSSRNRYIYLDGDKETLEKACDEGLIDWQEW